MKLIDVISSVCVQVFRTVRHHLHELQKARCMAEMLTNHPSDRKTNTIHVLDSIRDKMMCLLVMFDPVDINASELRHRSANVVVLYTSKSKI